MTEFDDKLLRSLSADDEAFLKDIEQDTGLFQQLGATFSGPLRYWTVFAFVLSFAVFALSMWAAYNMINASDLKAVVLWSALFGWASLGVAMLKIWFWMRMNHLNVLRELKRIELRIVRGAED